MSLTSSLLMRATGEDQRHKHGEAPLAYSDALVSYACALAADPLDPVARIGRLQTALLVGDYLTAYGDAFLLRDGALSVLDSAIVAQTAALAESPDNVGAYKVRAFLYLFSGQPVMAYADTESILSLQPDSSFAYLVRAASIETLGDAEGAGHAFQMAIDIASDDAQARVAVNPGHAADQAESHQEGVPIDRQIPFAAGAESQ